LLVVSWLLVLLEDADTQDCHLRFAFFARLRISSCSDLRLDWQLRFASRVGSQEMQVGWGVARLGPAALLDFSICHHIDAFLQLMNHGSLDGLRLMAQQSHANLE
jgi:hypothetical protein